MSLSAILLRPPEGAGPPPPAPPKPKVAERPEPVRGTPVDAPATRPDLAGEARPVEPAAPGWAVAAQAAAAPRQMADARQAAEAPKAEAPPPMVDTLKALRGQSSPVGALLDRAA
jgi:hypothetical protein